MTAQEWRPPKGSWASSAANRKSMRGNRSRDTSPELRLRSLIHARGLRYRVDHRPLPALRRKADLVFATPKVAVFVDGCFWHGCPEHFVEPSTNRDYWRDKIAGNVARDRDTDEALRGEGWTVLRYWEHDDPETVADEVERTVRSLEPTVKK